MKVFQEGGQKLTKAGFTGCLALGGGGKMCPGKLPGLICDDLVKDSRVDACV